MTKKNETAPNAAEKLAALIPSPEDATATTAIDKAPVNLPEAPDDSGLRVGAGAATAPPLHTLNLEEPKPARGGKGPTRKPAAGAGNLAATKNIQKLLPSNVRVHVYKRHSSGKMGFINDYSANDLAEQGSIERFLNEYVVPEYEYGEYAIYLQRPGKDLEAIGSVDIIPPASSKKPAGGSEMKELLELMFQRDQAAREQASQQKDPLVQMQETMAFLQTMKSSGDKEKPGMDPTMLMLMMMMKDKPAPIPTGPDPILLKVIERLERMEDERSQAAMFAQMPPPPPPPAAPERDPMESMAMVMKVLSDQQNASTQLLLEAMRSRNDRDPVQDLANLTRLTGANDDRITAKDLIQLYPTLKGMVSPDPAKSSLTEAIETMRSMKILEREFGGAPQDSGASSFWDFLRDFVTSDAGAQLAKRITAQQSAQQMDERHAARRRGAEELPREEEQPEQQGITIPESFRSEHAVAINNAATEAERLEALIKGLQHLGMHPEFRPYVGKIFSLAKKNRKMEALEFVAEFLSALVEADALEPEAAQLSVKDLGTHWNLTRQVLQMPDIPEVFPEGYEPEETEAEEEEAEEDQRHLRSVELDDGEDDDEIDPPRRPYRDPARDLPPPSQSARSEIQNATEPEAVTAG